MTHRRPSPSGEPRATSVDQALALARSALEPSAHVKARVWRAVAAPVPPPAAPPVPPTAAPSGSVPLARAPGRLRALRATGGLGLGLAAALAGAGFGSGYLAGRGGLDAPSSNVPAQSASAAEHPEPGTDDDEPTAGAVQPAAPRVVARDGSATTEGSPDRSVRRPPRVAKRAAPRPPPAARERAGAAALPSPRPPGGEPSVPSEVALLRRADRALRGGSPSFALVVLKRLDELHPEPQLAEEREAIGVMARCTTSASGARRDARQFLERHSTSLYAGRVRRLCAPGFDDSDVTGGASPDTQDR